MLSIRVALLMISSLFGATVASAQQAATTPAAALSECFVARSTGQDRVALVRWFASAVLAAPQVADLGRVSPEKREAVERDIAAIFTRLLTKDCLALSQKVAASGNSEGFKTAGEAFGRIAMVELLGNPGANAALQGFTRFVRQEDFQVLTPTK